MRPREPLLLHGQNREGKVQSQGVTDSAPPSIKGAQFQQLINCYTVQYPLRSFCLINTRPGDR